MLNRCLDAGAAYVPGTAFYPRKRDGRRAMRLNFSYPSTDDIDEGIRRIGSVVENELELARSLEADKGPDALQRQLCFHASATLQARMLS